MVSYCSDLRSSQVWEFGFQVLTVGALHQADSAALRSAASAWHDELAPLPKPLLVVNVGGPTSNLLCTYNLSSFCSYQILNLIEV
jgi:hypothetical protein